MADKETSRRQRRVPATKPAIQPAASHYVGYVEDDETPESIARKFEELERIQSRSDNTIKATRDARVEDSTLQDTTLRTESAHQPTDVASRGELTEEQLLEVFQQTSSFTVNSTTGNDHNIVRGENSGAEQASGTEDDGATDSNDDANFWPSDDSCDLSFTGKSRKRLHSGRLKGHEKGISISSDKPRYQDVTQFNASTRSFVRRRLRVEDPSAILQIRLPPPPLPASWGRAVQPWQPLRSCDQPSVYDGLLHTSLRDDTAPSDTACQDLGHCSATCQAAAQPAVVGRAADALARQYQAVMVNPGWAADAPTGSILQIPQKESQALSQKAIMMFAKLPIERLCPTGFVFVWAEKRFLHGIVKQMQRWSFTYIENLTWLQLKPNNKTVQADSSFLPRSHLTLLMFRKEGLGKDIDLRHQRSPDVFLDCIRTRPEGGWHVPEEAYLALETLLPTGKGQLLEIWAARDARRSGWTLVSDPFAA